MKKYIRILVLILAIVLYYFNGIYASDNYIKKLRAFLYEHDFAEIDSLFYEHSKLYVEDLDGKVKYKGTYKEFREELKKCFSDENVQINLSILDYKLSHNLYSITIKNSLFFQNDINGNYGELTYEVEFINIPFTPKIIEFKLYN